MKLWMAFLASGAVLAAAAASSGGESVPKALRETVERVNGAWNGQMRSGDAAGIASAYEDDGVFIGLDGGCTRGRAAVERRMRERFQKSGAASATEIHSRRLVADGALGYEWGDASMTFPGRNGSVTSAGRYLTVWRRAGDGTWRILRNVVLP